MTPFLQAEPVAIVNAVRLIILAGITFGLNITPAQLLASMTALEAVLTLATRHAVIPTRTVEDAGHSVPQMKVDAQANRDAGIA